jgi:hypothetical protein
MKKTPPVWNKVEIMNTSKFWPLDSDLEGAIYENVAWDLPGFRRPTLRNTPQPPKSKRKPH